MLMLAETETTRNIFTILNDALLKMTWLQDLVNKLLLDLFGMNPEGNWYPGVSFFLYDVVKIFILLSVLIYISSYIQTYFTVDRTRSILSKYKGVGANTIGALLGTVTPFCSCSSIPIFIGFTKAGLPIGVTFSFLISSPLVDLASVMLLAGIFGWEVAIIYVVVGLILAVLGGTIISKLKMEDQVADFLKEKEAFISENEEMKKPSRKERRHYSVDQVKSVIKKVWLYVLIGVGIGAVIHGWIPQAWIEAVLGADKWYSVLVATVVGIPMYADIFGALPIAEALVAKGIGLGTALAFLMSVTALSFPSIMMLSKVVKRKLLWTFVGIVTVGIIIIGFVFNYLVII